MFGVSQLMFAYVVYKTIRGGERRAIRCGGAHGLEWTLPSPPPYHSFTEAPEVK